MFGRKQRTYTTPAGVKFDLYDDMLRQNHLLVAGATGSGKSVVINGIITTALYEAPAERSFIFIDPKRVELCEYKNIPHCLFYASEMREIVQALQYAVEIVESRYKAMQKAKQRMYNGGHIYVIIDELADLMTTNKREVLPLLQRICQVGRACRVHAILATQCPLKAVIDTPIKCNIDSRVGLRTRSRQDSRNIMDFGGCELLPRYGQGYYMTPEQTTLYKIPMYPENERQRIIQHWEKQSA